MENIAVSINKTYPWTLIQLFHPCTGATEVTTHALNSSKSSLQHYLHTHKPRKQTKMSTNSKMNTLDKQTAAMGKVYSKDSAFASLKVVDKIANIILSKSNYTQESHNIILFVYQFPKRQNQSMRLIPGTCCLWGLGEVTKRTPDV